MTVPSITILTVRSVSEIVVHHVMSPSIPWPLSVSISLPLLTLGKASLMSIRSTPARWPSHQAASALSTRIATALIADSFFLLPYCPSLSCPLLSASSTSSFATSFSTTFPMQLSGEMERYVMSFMQSSFLCLQIAILQAHFHRAGCGPIRTAAFASPTILAFFHSQSRHMAPKNSLVGPGAFMAECENRAPLTPCSVMDWCACPAAGCLKYWS